MTAGKPAARGLLIHSRLAQSRRENGGCNPRPRDDGRRAIATKLVSVWRAGIGEARPDVRVRTSDCARPGSVSSRLSAAAAAKAGGAWRTAAQVLAGAPSELEIVVVGRDGRVPASSGFKRVQTQPGFLARASFGRWFGRDFKQSPT